MSIFDGAASVLASFRADNGQPVTWKGKVYQASTAAFQDSESPDLVRSGPSDNAADPDCRVFSFAPSVFAGSRPDRQSELIWQGATYVVTRAYLTAGMTTWRCVAYRQSTPNSADDNPSTGRRDDFRPPPASTS